jgi:crossover junction endodeoxyribonuclease RuvC
MIIVGWDPGLATLGFGVLESLSASTRVLDHGDIGEPADLDIDERLNRICRSVDHIMNKYCPDAMGIEAQAGVHTGKDREGQPAHISLRYVHAVTGILRMAGNTALAEAIPIYEPQPSSIKVALLGHGNGFAEKKQIREGVQRLFGVKRCNSHAADAIATSVCALKLHRAAERVARARAAGAR